MDQVLKQKLEMEAKEEEKKLKEMEQRFQVMTLSFLYIIQTIYMSRIANNQLKANFIWAPGSVPSQFGSTSLFVTKNPDWLLNWTLDIKLLVTHHIKISSFCISMSILYFIYQGTNQLFPLYIAASLLPSLCRLG